MLRSLEAKALCAPFQAIRKDDGVGVKTQPRTWSCPSPLILRPGVQSIGGALAVIAAGNYKEKGRTMLGGIEAVPDARRRGLSGMLGSLIGSGVINPSRVVTSWATT